MAQITIKEIVESYMSDNKASFKDLPTERKRELYSELHKKIKSIVHKRSVESIPKMIDGYKTTFLKESEDNMFLNLANRTTQDEKVNEFKEIINKNGYNCEFPDLKEEDENLSGLKKRLKNFPDPTSKKYVAVSEDDLDLTIGELLQLYKDASVTQNRFRIIKQAVIDEPLKANKLIDEYIATAGEDPTLDVFEMAHMVHRHEYKDVIKQIENEKKRLRVLNKAVPVVKDPDAVDNSLGFNSSFVGDSFEYSMGYDDYLSKLFADEKTKTPSNTVNPADSVVELEKDEPENSNPNPTTPPRTAAKEPKKRETVWEFGKRVEDEKKPYEDLRVDVNADNENDFLSSSNELLSDTNERFEELTKDAKWELADGFEGPKYEGEVPNSKKVGNLNGNAYEFYEKYRNSNPVNSPKTVAKDSKKKETVWEFGKRVEDEKKPNTGELLKELVDKIKDEPKDAKSTNERFKEVVNKSKLEFVDGFKEPKYDRRVPNDAYKFYEQYRNKDGQAKANGDDKVSDKHYEDIKKVLQNTVDIYRNSIDLLYSFSSDKLEKSGRQLNEDSKELLDSINNDLTSIEIDRIEAVEKALKDDDRNKIEEWYNSKKYVVNPSTKDFYVDNALKPMNYYKFMNNKMGNVAQKLKENGVDIYNVFNSSTVVADPDAPAGHVARGYAGVDYVNSYNFKNAMNLFTKPKTDEKVADSDNKNVEESGKNTAKGENNNKKADAKANSDEFVAMGPDIKDVEKANAEFEENQKLATEQNGEKTTKNKKEKKNRRDEKQNTSDVDNNANKSTTKNKKKDNVFKRIGKWMARKPVLTATLLFATIALPVTGALSTTILPSVFLFGTVGLLASNGVKGAAKGVSPRYKRFIYNYDIDKKMKKLEVTQERMASKIRYAQNILDKRDVKEKRTYVELPQNSKGNGAEYALGYYKNKKDQIKKTASRKRAERSIKSSEKAERKLANIDYNLSGVEAKQINEIVKLGKKEDKMKKAIGKKYDKMMSVRGIDGATYRADAEMKENMENSTALKNNELEMKTAIDDIAKVKHFARKIKSQEKKDVKTENKIEKIMEESLSDEKSRREALDYIVKDMIANDGKVNSALMNIVNKKVGKVGAQYIKTRYEESQIGNDDTSASETIYGEMEGKSSKADSNIARAESYGRYAYRSGMSVMELAKRIKDPKLQKVALDAYDKEEARDNDRLM